MTGGKEAEDQNISGPHHERLQLTNVRFGRVFLQDCVVREGCCGGRHKQAESGTSLYQRASSYIEPKYDLSPPLTGLICFENCLSVLSWLSCRYWTK